MGGIGAISAFGSQAVTNRFQQSQSPKALTALEAAKKVRLGPVGKTEQQIHLEKAKEMAEAGAPKESLHAKVTRETNENPEKANLHLALMRKKNAEPPDPMKGRMEDPLMAAMNGSVDGSPAKQKQSVDGISAGELAAAGSKHNAQVAQANNQASAKNAQQIGAQFDPGSSANAAKNFFNGGKDVSGYDPSGQALKGGGQPVGGVLNIMA